MKSPFPGMDPYLENPRIWPDVHHEVLSVSREFLNRSLRPRYHVDIEERVYVSDENDPGRKAIKPDVQIAHSEKEVYHHGSGNAAVAEPVVLTTLIEDEIHEARLEIIDADQRTVVSVIELLSPTNKIIGSRGRASYEQKRKEVMLSSSHFVEIDLLRDGEHLHVRELLPHADYYVHVSKKTRRPKGIVWPILLPQCLPIINIPLKPEDPDVDLDLQAVLSTAYERAGYDLRIDYRSDPKPPLPEAYADWLIETLKAAHE